MGAILKSIALITILLSLSDFVEAKTASKKEKKVDVKCFVELLGGGDVVSFWRVPQSKVLSLSKSITGHKVVVPNSNQKMKIYKTHECVLLKDNFVSSRAKIVDAKTAR